MTRRRSTRWAAAAVLPAALSAVALALGAQPAGAAVVETRQHSFTDLNGSPRTCTIEVVRQYPFGNDNQVGRGSTTMRAGGGAACTDGVAFISATWSDPDGLTVTTEENSDGTSTARRFAPVGSAFTTVHAVEYFDCLEDCRVTFTRTK